MKRAKRLAIGILVSLALCPAARAATYQLDPAHTTVGFRIRHLLSYVQGTFNEFDGTFEYDPEHPEASAVQATIRAGSLDTRHDKRDTHLRSADFFDAERFPVMTFTSTQVTDATPRRAMLHGLLTLHGVERPVVLEVDIHGIARDPWGNTRSGFTAKTVISRKEFGLAWNQTLETGQVLIGDEVEITIEVEGLQAS